MPDAGHLRFSMETCKRQIKQDKELEDKRLLLAKAAVTSHAKAKNTKTAVGVSVTAGCICCEFKKLIEESTREDSSSFTPSSLLYAVWSSVEYMAGYSQQDAHEFLIAFLNGLDTHIVENHPPIVQTKSLTNGAWSSISTAGCTTASSSLSSPSSSSSSSQSGAPNSINSGNRIAEVFSGTIQSDLICQECGNSSVTKENFTDLSLSIGEASLASAVSSSSNLRSAASCGSLQQAGAGGERTRKRARTLSTSSAPENSPALSGDDGVSGGARSAFPSFDETISSGTSDETESVCVPAVVTRGQTNTTSLADCLMHYTSLEPLNEKIKCDKCNAYQNCHKQLSIVKPPEVLILHLKRFDMQKDRKVTTKVSFPVRNFDISPFMTPSSSSSSSSDGGNNGVRSGEEKSRNDSIGSGSSDGSGGSLESSNGLLPAGKETRASPGRREENMYELQGVVTHSGSLHQGHYVAYVSEHNQQNGMQRKWLRCDDETIKTVKEEDVANAEAYLLFYVKQKKR